MKKKPLDGRLVCAWLKFGTALLWFLTAIVNAVFSYYTTYGRKVAAQV